MGGVFIYAGAAKIASSREFARIVANYGLLPESLSVYLAYTLPWIELLLGAFLILGFRIRETALALSLLLAIFAGAVLLRYFREGTVNCGCFSMTSSGQESLALIIGRDLVLLVCGIFIFFDKGKTTGILSRATTNLLKSKD